MSDTHSGAVKRKSGDFDLQGLLAAVHASLDDSKAEEIVTIDLKGKSSIADYMVIANGRSQRQVASIADRLVEDLKKIGHSVPRIEGLPTADWVLVDAGDIVAHIFRPEVRSFYNLEKMWSVALDEAKA